MIGLPDNCANKRPGFSISPGRNKISVFCVMLLIFGCFVIPDFAYAQSKQSDNKQEKLNQEKSSQQAGSGQKSAVTQTSDKEGKTPEIDWGDWNTELSPPIQNNEFGVGINGKVEAELSRLDKSNLLENPTGVAVKEKAKDTGKNKKQTDLKKTMAELEALEAKVKKEIEDDSEF